MSLSDSVPETAPVIFRLKTALVFRCCKLRLRRFSGTSSLFFLILLYSYGRIADSVFSCYGLFAQFLYFIISNCIDSCLNWYAPLSIFDSKSVTFAAAGGCWWLRELWLRGGETALVFRCCKLRLRRFSGTSSLFFCILLYSYG